MFKVKILVIYLIFIMVLYILVISKYFRKRGLCFLGFLIVWVVLDMIECGFIGILVEVKRLKKINK